MGETIIRLCIGLPLSVLILYAVDKLIDSALDRTDRGSRR